MLYNFDEIVPRRGSGSYKWDSACAKDKMPLWVADMDFKAAPCIIRAMQQRLDHGVFGYTLVGDSYYEAVGRWFAERHGWHGISRENSIYTIGVVPAISAILQTLCNPGDNVLTLAPTYNCFYSSIRNSRCTLVESEMVCTDNYYRINRPDFEAKIQDAKVLLLCNPQNPVGRIWTQEELTFIARLAEKYNVFVISDEIHCEFAFPGNHYTPYATIAQGNNLAVCTSASKAFNIAGLQMANIFCPDAGIRARIDKQINVVEICDVNPFGPIATEAAYTEEGAQWLRKLMQYIEANYHYLATFLQTHFPSAQLTRMDGTYLAWVKNSPEHAKGNHFSMAKAEEKGVLFNDGSMYGTGGEGYTRINLACPQSVLAEALNKLIE